MCRINYAELPLKEGEVLIENNHILSEINGDIVELKYCSHCKQWHPLTDFMKCSSTSDGLQNWCRSCQNEYNRLRNALKKSSNQDSEEQIVPFEQEEVLETDCYDKALDLLSSLRLRDEELQQEIKRLKEEIKSLKFKAIDLESLSERDIERVLKSNKITPRLLFEAIARIDNRYTFYAKDSVSGQTYPVKISQEAA